MSSPLKPDDSTNPYAAPSARIDDLAAPLANELASRSTRLGAAILDSLLFMVPIALVAGFGAITGRASPGAAPATPMAMGLVALFILVLAVVNLVLIVRSQQTIGKKVCKIKVVRGDGSPCSGVRIIFLRGGVMALLGAIPFIGRVIQLVDSLLIFRDDHRCVHDHIADTLVVRV